MENSKLRYSSRGGASTSFKANQTVDKQKGLEADKLKGKAVRDNHEDKLASLKLYRSKNGLCFKCGEKWAPGHKCPNQVSIHVLEQLLDAVDDLSFESTEILSEMSEPEGVLAIGSDAAKHATTRKTMRLCGTIGALDIMILVDSGSVGSFISSQLAEQLKNQVQSCTISNFITADGSPMTCDQSIPELQWSTQGHTITTVVGSPIEML